MDVRIEANGETGEHKVWFDDHALSFSSLKEAEAWLAKRQERIDAAVRSFATKELTPQTE